MPSNAVGRVRYFPGQFLRTPDFADEQAYHRDMRRRHNIAHHSLGIVAGLELTLQDGVPVVEPGMAVDGYGRELVLPERRQLDVPRVFTARGSDRLDVWIAYDLVSGESAPSGYASCIDEAATTYRDIELPRVRLTTPDPDHPHRRCPGTVEDDGGCRVVDGTTVDTFPPHQTPPDSPTMDWPVFLGSVTRASEDGQDTYTIDTDGRPYAGLVGERISAPSGRAWVQVGAEDEKDPYRFAVHVPQQGQPDIPRIAVAADGTVIAVGRTTMLGNAAVEGGLEIKPEKAEKDLSKVNAGHWTMSHHQDEQGGEELRIQLGTSGKLVVGTWDAEQKTFLPCLSVQDCAVTVHGNLVVEGTLETPNTEREGAPWSEEARRQLHSSRLTGVAGVTTVVDDFLRSPPSSHSERWTRLLGQLESTDNESAVSPDQVDELVTTLQHIATNNQPLQQQLKTVFGSSEDG